jgi:hypothetical protein
MHKMTMRLTKITYTKRLFRRPLRHEVTEDFGGNTSDNIQRLINAMICSKADAHDLRWGDLNESITLSTLFIWLDSNATLAATKKAVEAHQMRTNEHEFNRRVEREIDGRIRHKMDRIKAAALAALADELAPE